MNKKSNFNQILVIIALVAVGFYLGFIFPGVKDSSSDVMEENAVTQQSTQETAVGIDEVKSAFNNAAIKFGDDSRKVIFLEISDPSCPYCNIAAGYNSELNSQAGSNFKLVEDGGTYIAPVKEMKKLVDSGDASFAMLYQNGHGNGEMAMKALYCANEVGKFWEAKALLFSGDGYDLINENVKNDKTKSGVLADFLAPVVDKNTMKSCLDSGKYDAQLSTDSSTATSLGVQGTPGFFVNDKNYAGAYSYSDMESVVKSALEK